MANTGVPTPEREKEVTEQIRYLDESVSRLNQTIERLGPALSEVMSESSPRVAEDKPIKEICSLANEIRSVRFRIDEMDEYVRDKLERIEV